MGSNIAAAALVIVGTLMVILGMFGGPEYVVMGMGLVALVAAGVLSLLQARVLSR
jgi:hypothetical protein